MALMDPLELINLRGQDRRRCSCILRVVTILYIKSEEEITFRST